MTGKLIPAGLLVLATAFAAVPVYAHAQEPLRASEEVELIQLERDWDHAFLQNDTAFIDRVLAREFVAIYPDGSKGDRAMELANAAAFKEAYKDLLKMREQLLRPANSAPAANNAPGH